MLILTTQDIQYCQLKGAKSSSKTKYLGIFYRGFLFVKVESFSHNQLSHATSRCRQFLEKEKPITSIILKETNNITLWREAPELNLVLPERELVNYRDNNSEIRPQITPQATFIEDSTRENITSVKQSPISKKIINKRKKKLKYRGVNY